VAGHLDKGTWMSLTNPLSSAPEDRLARALISLDGLSVGDAFGQQFFIPGMRDFCIQHKDIPPPKWQYTDDTEMALAIVETLKARSTIDQDYLAGRFAARFANDPARGYGAGAQRLLRDINAGADWRQSSRELFHGMGSFGNGGAMRVAPLGAYFADDLEQVITQAVASAEVTHAHPEGIAGAVAIAVATSWCVQLAHQGAELKGTELLQFAIEYTPPGETRQAMEQTLEIPLDHWEYSAAHVLGNGGKLSAQDTVPFCLWCAAAHLDSFRDALWAAMLVEGDVDTNCAIIGGIVAAAVGRAGIPAKWLRSREEFLIK
jgi:ADP-ribosylglycohydrolase